MRNACYWQVACAALAALIVGCATNPGGGGGGTSTPPTTLLAVTGRTIPAGQALALSFEPDAGRLVTISVQASNDQSNPDFRLVEGQVDFEDLEELPIADLVLVSAANDLGQEVNQFTPEVKQVYTLFVEDRNDWPGTTFSVSATQR